VSAFGTKQSLVKNMTKLNELTDKCLSNLKKKSFTELSQLKDYQEEKAPQCGKSYAMSVWKDVIADNEIRIVVQSHRYWFLGISNIYADGFRIYSEGKITNLTEEELYDFT